ncbi:hypothetical protein V496_10645 [Pseudogymnoascus sp. VKM F-4515 (FW-2607)]|nr:hypothetical protein V496_10645 [Pseudogymnoascus sp. VKM F-4515 (FW-2607)]KFY94350.1 hypothetical protein V498_03900 [Pseudogymnoascus sp. VKM F-4517 (FW-2822)]
MISNGAFPGTLHHYAGKLVAFELTAAEKEEQRQNILFFIGGLGDGLLTVPYAAQLARQLPPTWSLVQVQLSSSHIGWGTSSLGKDVDELSQCVDYFRNIAGRSGKVVFMGHSTGCQDVMHYLVGPGKESRAPIDGGILQASVSDRQAMEGQLDEKQRSNTNKIAAEWVAAGRGEDVLSSAATHGFFDAPICARRWLSLASPNHDGEDDYFSSDLTDEQYQRSFGSLPKRSKLCILYSGKDEYVPEHVDRKALVEKWIGIVKRGSGEVDEKNSAVVEGATHDLKNNPEEVINGVFTRVIGFVSDL